MKSLQGHLLVASPDLVDPNFVKTVVLMVQHSQQGAFGLVLNRPTQTTLGKALEQVTSIPCPRHEILSLGGPCEGALMAVHMESMLRELEVIPNVYLSTASENLEQLIAMVDATARFFVGFSGWGPGQLEAELAGGSWRTVAASQEHIFSAPVDLWLDVTRKITRNALLSSLKIPHIPDDPSVN
jgi:putative transcriptional regulator